MQINNNDATFAARAAYEGYSHNWWQFSDNAVFAKYQVWSGCGDTPAKTYTILPDSILPWQPGTVMNIITVPAL